MVPDVQSNPHQRKAGVRNIGAGRNLPRETCIAVIPATAADKIGAEHSTSQLESVVCRQRNQVTVPVDIR